MQRIVHPIVAQGPQGRRGAIESSAPPVGIRVSMVSEEGRSVGSVKGSLSIALAPLKVRVS